MNRTDIAPHTADGRTRPLVWVKKIVLYKSIDPMEGIRQIAFTTGLNIIQGESNQSDEAFQSGHGIGKTTECRLIRYCLGEDSYGQKHVIEEVKHCFPDSYVGAVIELSGSDWAVLRPLGNRLREYALEGAPLDGLVQAEGPKRYGTFLERLTSLVLVHDSPREADLNLRIYQRLLDVADEHLRTSGQNGVTPYQYIVSTTTLPSKGLQKKSITKVELSGGEGSLFKMQLEAGKPPPEQPTLFNAPEDQ